jgi:FkbM family methyltransferase
MKNIWSIQFMKLKMFLFLSYIIFLTKTYAVCDFVKIEETKNKFANAWSKCGTINLSSRIDVHKAMIATYFTMPEDLVFDLGSHLGDYALLYNQLIGDNGLVIAYEASPPIFAALQNRVKQFKNIMVKNKAVSSTSNEKICMKIYPNDIGPQCCSVEPFLWKTERMPGNTAIVEVCTEKLDDVVETNMYPLHFIKIDVEGHEHAVFEGAIQLLLQKRPLIIFEYGYGKNIFEPNTIQQLEKLNYVCYDCANDQRVHPGYEITITDLLAIPVEREKEVVELLPHLHY